MLDVGRINESEFNVGDGRKIGIFLSDSDMRIHVLVVCVLPGGVCRLHQTESFQTLQKHSICHCMHSNKIMQHTTSN